MPSGFPSVSAIDTSACASSSLVRGRTAGSTIPSGSRLYGGGMLEGASQRVVVQFDSVVFPTGEERSISAEAQTLDGQSGLPGEYHSGGFQKQAGKVASSFTAGLAHGLMDREAGGMMGAPFEPGNLKNGLLNGIKSSAVDYAQNYSQEMQQVKPYATVEPGTQFRVFLKQGF